MWWRLYNYYQTNKRHQHPRRSWKLWRLWGRRWDFGINTRMVGSSDTCRELDRGDHWPENQLISFFLAFFVYSFLKTFGFLQVTKDKFCRPERKQCKHRQELDTSCYGTYSSTADLVTADTPLGDPLGPASHAQTCSRVRHTFLIWEEDCVTS